MKSEMQDEDMKLLKECAQILDCEPEAVINIIKKMKAEIEAFDEEIRRMKT